MNNEYAFLVRGRLSPDIVAALHPLLPTRLATETELRGAVADPATLQEIITRLEQLGVELVAVRRLPHRRQATSARR